MTVLYYNRTTAFYCRHNHPPYCHGCRPRCTQAIWFYVCAML